MSLFQLNMKFICFNPFIPVVYKKNISIIIYLCNIGIFWKILEREYQL